MLRLDGAMPRARWRNFKSLEETTGITAVPSGTLTELAQSAGIEVPTINRYGSFAHFSAAVEAVEARCRTGQQ